jgi:hypothetical protein
LISVFEVAVLVATVAAAEESGPSQLVPPSLESSL